MRGLQLPAAMCSFVHGERSVGTPSLGAMRESINEYVDKDGFHVVAHTHEPVPPPQVAWADGGYLTEVRETQVQKSRQVGTTEWQARQREKQKRYAEGYGSGVVKLDPGPGLGKTEWQEWRERQHKSLAALVNSGIVKFNDATQAPATMAADASAVQSTWSEEYAALFTTSPGFETVVMSNGGSWFVRRKADLYACTPHCETEDEAVAAFRRLTSNKHRVETSKDREASVFGLRVGLIRGLSSDGPPYVIETYHTKTVLSDAQVLAHLRPMSENGVLTGYTQSPAARGGSYLEVRRLQPREI